MKIRDEGATPESVKALGVAIRVPSERRWYAMPKHRQHTPKRPRKLKVTEIAAIVAALGTLLSGLAAILHALT